VSLPQLASTSAPITIGDATLSLRMFNDRMWQAYAIDAGQRCQAY
jgi:hypothetical protein